MTAARTTSRVFISHSHQGDELVRDLARRLREAGLNPLVDFADRPAAADWKKKVREQVREADAVLILVTPAALNSPWMMTELGMADGFDRLVLPVTIGLKPDDLPAPLQTYQVVPFDQVDGAIRMLSENTTAAAKD